MPLEHEVEKERAQEAAKKLKRAYECLFTGNHDAPIVLRDLCLFAKVFEPSFRGETMEVTMRNDGMREIVLRILHLSGIDRKMIDQLGVIG